VGGLIGRGGGGYGNIDLGGRGKSDISISAGSPIMMGSLDKEIIRRVIRRSLARVKYCYERQLAKNPSLAGKLVVGFTIQPDGTVTGALVKSSTIGDVEVGQCVVKVVKALKFPKPAGGGVVIVTYPFNFSRG
jgi:TonB family protein